MQRGKLLIILGAIMGLCTVGAIIFIALSLIVTRVTRTETTESTAGQPLQVPTLPMVEVIVVLQSIPRGSEFVAGSIGYRAWPAANVPSGVVENEAETIGQVAKQDIFQGQLLLRAMMVAKAELNDEDLCQSYSSSMTLAASSRSLKVGDVVTITTTLNNEGCVAFGLPSISLLAGPQFEPSRATIGQDIHQRSAVNPGSSLQVETVFQAIRTGKAEFRASSSFEIEQSTSAGERFFQWAGASTEEPLIIEVLQ